MIKRIALVDWKGSGHHPTFFNHFLLAFEELGIDVLAHCPDPSAAAALADETRGNSVPGARGTTRFLPVTVPAKRFRTLRPRRISAIDWSIRHFRGIENQLIDLQRESGKKLDAVFHACIYDIDFQWMWYAAPFLRLPWTGLYLHAMSYRMPGRPHPVTRKVPCPKSMFSSRLCRGIAVLDEGIADRMSQEIRKPVLALPDPADERLAANASERVLGDQLKQFAAGRPIVGLFGHLQKSKGLLAFLEAARMPAASGICFALGGEMLWPADPTEARQARKLLGDSANLWTHLERIPTEPALSHLMASCDVLAASYVDFPHSSGIQAKAAALQKPLIVSDGYLMAERSRRFRMGAVVEQNHPEKFLEAVIDITRDPAGWVKRTQPLWQEYLREHSFDRLKEQLGKLLSQF